MPCHQSNGGFKSGITLCNYLSKLTDLTIWSLWGELYSGHQAILESTGAELRFANPVLELEDGDHVFFYMNDYPFFFANFSQQWKAELNKAASVQIAFNRILGGVPGQAWLAHNTTSVYFLDQKMQRDWGIIVKRNDLSEIPTHVLVPPIELEPFSAIGEADRSEDKLIISRLAGDGDVDSQSIDIYQTLADKLPHAEFWFMPSPPELAREFADDSRFRFLSPNQIPVTEFLAKTTIFMLTYKQSVPIPGPRCLVEAMAAGCVPIVVNREGPKDRVLHAENGFCANSNQEFIDYALKLAADIELRNKLSQAARARAKSFKIEHWIERIMANIYSQ